MRDGLNVGPEDQSLWYYHQFLITNIVESQDQEAIVPGLTTQDKINYIGGEIHEIKDLLEDYDDVKRIYEALVDLKLLTARLESRALRADEKEETLAWVDRLRELDPMRNGRWDDLGKDLV